MSQQHHEPEDPAELHIKAEELEAARRTYTRARSAAMSRHPSMRARFNQIAFHLVTDEG